MTTQIIPSDGYSQNIFHNKKEHMDKVIEIVTAQGYIPPNHINSEVEWFYTNLGIDDLYFSMEEPEIVAEHVVGLYAAEISAIASKKEKININFHRETPEASVFIHTSVPGISAIDGPHYEVKIDSDYLDISTPECAYRLESYRSSGTVSQKYKSSVRAYFINKCDFPVVNPTDEESRDITKVADKTFLAKATQETLEQYQSLMNKAIERAGPVISIIYNKATKEHRVLIGYRQGSTNGYFSGISDLYHYNGLYSKRKFVEQFSNGITIISLNFVPARKMTTDETILAVEHVGREASLLYCLPKTPLQNLFKKGELSVQETVYAFVCSIFAQHFLNRLGSEYTSLVSMLDGSSPETAELLSRIKKRLRQETFTKETIMDVIMSQSSLIKTLYKEFARVHHISHSSPGLKPSLSSQRFADLKPVSEEKIDVIIRSAVSNNNEYLVMKSFYEFNKNVLKTNFYQPTKVALSFRMSPDFLPDIEYPIKPFGIFLVIGAEFRGFHVRFQEIARGGIRIIHSRNSEAYTSNQRSLFDENYSLALTQHKKNKDIPEGGSKGTILLNFESQDKPFVAFEKYVDSILDLLLGGQTPGIKEKIVDLYDKPEILFFGPDEGTAGYMDWASKHAHHRGAHFWKAFTTGKSQSMGGIPHDKYAMTTNSVHQYVLGILKKLDIDETKITKFQTGGPDGDLGSNEILISKDKTTSVVDGSGVLHDPNGIDRSELTRLAKARKMISEFDISKLGQGGFRVLVEENNIKLPNGTIVTNGLDFRNNYHTNPLSAATLFVPCGGRPESIDVNNVSKLINSEGVPRFKYVVEGANLFFTQDARIRLENAGVHLIKDASSNKGGVTSSSLEVLAALAFSDEEHKELMCTQPDGSLPQFYQDYVKQVQQRIIQNANNEFECIWREYKRTNKPKCILTDEVSNAIVSMRSQLETTNLWENIPLRIQVLSDALPKFLLDNLGIEKIIARVPESYLKAIFGGYLASGFIYQYGTEPTQFSFFEYMAPIYTKIAKN
ncbi:hypothetical protein BB559_004418 [Furculomyces boomerangus]|uniref:NAD-specific glutamate dehydrogenase n=2 Tax=Harpellales TaxID=61421 RepID=A0A2T9YEW0_9FUNG|nr:hypothetical protein BB559_004418 [Furculomyces boomerangus]PWA00549.1 hypothetical protein BB558_003398 [Smittium angustum]